MLSGPVYPLCISSKLIKNVNVHTDRHIFGPVLLGHDRNDDLIMMSAADYAAYRNETNGSYFIQLFCDVMLQRAHQEHFLNIYTEVTDP